MQKARHHASQESRDVLAGVNYRFASTILFTAMAAMVKLATEAGVHFVEIVFYRQLFAMIPVTFLLLTGPGLSTVRTAHLGLHATRSLVGLGNMCMVFAAIALLPLAEATTIQFSAPIFATAMAALFLGEVVRLPRWSATVIGFIGIIIVASPGGAEMVHPLGVGLGIAGAAGTAAISILLRQMNRSENHLAIVFWFGGLSVPILLPLMFFFAGPHDAPSWAIIVAIGLLGGTAQLVMTMSLKKAPVSVVLPIDYFSLLWSIFAGWLLWNQLPALSTWYGAPLVVGSGMFIAWREHKRARSTHDHHLDPR